MSEQSGSEGVRRKSGVVHRKPMSEQNKNEGVQRKPMNEQNKNEDVRRTSSEIEKKPSPRQNLQHSKNIYVPVTHISRNHFQSR